jgi:hypothetical protein
MAVLDAKRTFVTDGAAGRDWPDLANCGRAAVRDFSGRADILSTTIRAGRPR